MYLKQHQRTQRIKIKLRSFKSSEHFNEKGDGPYRGFGYLSLFSDPIDFWQHGAKEDYSNFAVFIKGVDAMTSIIQMGRWLENESKTIINF